MAWIALALTHALKSIVMGIELGRLKAVGFGLVVYDFFDTAQHFWA